MRAISRPAGRVRYVPKGKHVSGQISSCAANEVIFAKRDMNREIVDTDILIDTSFRHAESSRLGACQRVPYEPV